MTRDEDTREWGRLDAFFLLLIPLCCLLPFLVVAGISIGLAAALGGLLLAGIAVVVVVGLLVLRGRRRGLSRPAPRR